MCWRPVPSAAPRTDSGVGDLAPPSTSSCVKIIQLTRARNEMLSTRLQFAMPRLARPLCGAPRTPHEVTGGTGTGSGLGAADSAEDITVLKLYRDCMRLTYHIAANVRAGQSLPPPPRARHSCTLLARCPLLSAFLHAATAERKGAGDASDGPLELPRADARDGSGGDPAAQDAWRRGPSELRDPRADRQGHFEALEKVAGANDCVCSRSPPAAVGVSR